jgi:branched-chain amino acid transport system substrate-binding protein
MRIGILSSFTMIAIWWASAALAAEPIRIGVSLGLTGQYEQPALMHQRAYLLCQDQINARGGIFERKLAFDIRDDHGSAEEARAIYLAFTAEDGVDIVLAPYSSDLTAAVAPIAEERGFPMLAAGAAADLLWRRGYHNLIGVLTPASRYTQGMMRLATEADFSTIALLHAGDDFSREIAAGTRKWAPFLKLKIVSDIELYRGSEGDKDIMLSVRNSGADLLIVAGYFDEAARMRRAMGGIGWYPQAYFATVGPSFPNWKSLLGADAERAFTTSIWEPARPDESTVSQQFAQAFKDRYAVIPSYHAAAAFAACQVLEAALIRAGSTDHDHYRDALFALDSNTVIGRFAVDRTGMQTKRLDMVVQWIDGEKQIVWPAEVRTHQAVFGTRSP